MIVSWRNFSGEIPRLLPSRLPEAFAQSALNAGLSRGDLRPFKQPEQLFNVPTLVRSLWTPDGQRFMHWDHDVDVVRGPVLEDQYKRVYFTNATGLWVTHEDQALVPTGGVSGPPQVKYRAGVPAMPKPTIVVEDYDPGITLKFTFFYEAAGVKYQEQDANENVVDLGAKYWFTPPAKDVAPEGEEGEEEDPTAPNSSQTPAGYTPSNAMPIVRVLATKDDKTVFDVYSAGSAFNTTDPTPRVTLEADPDNAARMFIVLDYTAGALVETRAYIVTAINQWYEEGQPSEHVLVTVNVFQKVKITCTLPALNTIKNFEFAPLLNIRVYRTAQSTSVETDYFKVFDQVIADGLTFYDETLSSELAPDTCESWEWEPAPVGMTGLTYLGNGMLAGVTVTKEVAICEPFRPHAWPRTYWQAFPGMPIRIVPNGNSHVVTTTGYPYLLVGSTPDGMVQQRLTAMQAAVSKRAHADLGGVIAYASNDGVVLVNGGQASLDASLALWGREKWRELYGPVLYQMEFAAHDGMLFAFAESRDEGFMVRFDEAGGTLTRINTAGFKGSFLLDKTDSLYIGRRVGGDQVAKFAAGADDDMTWHSREVTLPKPYNMGACQVSVESGSAVVTVYADGVQADTWTVAAGVSTRRLPTNPICRFWSVKIAGQAVIREMHLANTVQELRSV
jgi:hypothetical protein